MKRVSRALVVLGVGSFLMGCGSKSSETGGITLANTEPSVSQKIFSQAATPEQCAAGGIAIKIYVDANSNDVLDADEVVTSTQVICSGTDGKNGNDGKDGNDGSDGKDGQDGQDGLDGKDGADGKNGNDGRDGQDGKDGSDGKDGTSAHPLVFKIDPVAPGCKNGGSTISFGIDLDDNGVLDENDGSIQSQEICNGENGKDGEAGTTPPPAPLFTCDARFDFTSTWNDGYILEVVVKNVGPEMVGWAVGFKLPGSHVITNLWNAQGSLDKNGKFTGIHQPYNVIVSENGEIKFGMQVSRSDNALPQVNTVTLNGVACNEVR